jgi:glycosyltransferase involved in cell wall biosynthesis
MRYLEFTSPVLWLYYTEISERLIGQCNEKLAICDVFDKYSAYPCYDPWGARRVEAQEEQLLHRVDLVLAVSEPLCAYCQQFSKEVFLVPNGVDLALYEAPGPPPDDIAAIPHPIVGFTGKIASNKIDLGLLRYLVEKRPEWSVVLIGPVFPDLQRVIAGWQKYQNLHLLGQKDLWQLPAYLGAFDVCIIPYLRNEERLHCDPLKAYEYLAAGKPIVASDFSPAFALKDLMEVASSPEEFVSRIEESLKKDNEALKRKRIDVARQNSWDTRVKNISRVIESYLMVK